MGVGGSHVPKQTSQQVLAPLNVPPSLLQQAWVKTEHVLPVQQAPASDAPGATLTPVAPACVPVLKR
jgi:hypothetical protein